MHGGEVGVQDHTWIGGHEDEHMKDAVHVGHVDADPEVAEGSVQHPANDGHEPDEESARGLLFIMISNSYRLVL